MSLIKCKECGNEVSDTAETCPKCGIKIISKAKTEKSEKKKLKLKFFIAIVILILIGGGIGIFAIQQNKLSTYKQNYEEILDEIVDSSSQIEHCLSLYRKVWYNTIYEESDSETDPYTKNEAGKFNDDFNDSLMTLWISSEYTSSISEIKEASINTIPSLYKKLKNPPSKMKDAFEDLEELYDAYLSFAEMAIDPSGSLTSFTQKYNDLDSKIATAYQKAYNNIDSY